METPRTAVFALCRQIVVDTERNELVIETDLRELAQYDTPSGLPGGLCMNRLPE